MKDYSPIKISTKLENMSFLIRFIFFYHPSSESEEQNMSEMILDVILHVSQMLCFPFALDTHEMMLAAILASFKQCLFVHKLVAACQIHVPLEAMEVPMGEFRGHRLNSLSCVVQWNLVIKRSDITKPSYNKVILLVPALYIYFFFNPDIMRNLI